MSPSSAIKAVSPDTRAGSLSQSDRPYRPGMEVEEAVAELRRCSGTQFEPEIVEALARLVEQGELTVLAMRTPAA